MTLRATDPDSDYLMYNRVEFKYAGNENPPKADGTDRFTVSDAGQISVVSTLDKETDSVITFEVLAMDGSPDFGTFVFIVAC